MAKKTSKKQTADTVVEKAIYVTIASKAAVKVAERIFKQNPDIKEVYVTTDGTAFYGRNDAQNHANKLGNREVFSFKRGASITVKPANPATPTTDKDAPAPDSAYSENFEEEEIDELTGMPVNNETSNTGE